MTPSKSSARVAGGVTALDSSAERRRPQRRGGGGATPAAGRRRTCRWRASPIDYRVGRRGAAGYCQGRDIERPGVARRPAPSELGKEQGMSGVRVLVGTRKGAFVLTADGKRQRWDVSGPHFGGWEIYHIKGSPADPDRLYASQSSS